MYSYTYIKQNVVKKTMLSDADKCKLINLKEELEVFLLNRAVCYSISQSSIRKEFEEGIDFFKNYIHSIQLQDDKLQSRLELIDQCTKRFQKLKQCRISTMSHKKLFCLCELLYSKIVLLCNSNCNVNFYDLALAQAKNTEMDMLILKAEKDIENKSIEKIPVQEQKLLFKEWKQLLNDLKCFSSTLTTLNENKQEQTFLIYQSLQCRLKKYEHDLIILRHKNEYCDTLYMEFYKVSKALYTINPVFYKNLQQDSENFDFYNDIHTTELLLRTKINDITKLNYKSIPETSETSEKSLTSINSIKNQSPENTKSPEKCKSFEKPTKTNLKRKRVRKVQISEEQKTETLNNTFVKRGGPKYCPGCPSVNPTCQPHICLPKTVFFPFLLDKIERCLQCHEQIVLFNGGKIQNSFSKKRKS